MWSHLQKWEPIIDEIKTLAEEIALKFARTTAVDKAQEKQTDDWLTHCIYFIQDALIFCEFEHAVSYADVGRVLQVLKYWTLAFHGADQYNYA